MRSVGRTSRMPTPRCVLGKTIMVEGGAIQKVHQTICITVRRRGWDTIHVNVTTLYMFELRIVTVQSFKHNSASSINLYVAKMLQEPDSFIHDPWTERSQNDYRTRPEPRVHSKRTLNGYNREGRWRVLHPHPVGSLPLTYRPTLLFTQGECLLAECLGGHR